MSIVGTTSGLRKTCDDEETARMVAAERRKGTTGSLDTVCACCGTATSWGRLKAAGMRRAVLAFVLVPALTATLAIVLGVEPVIANVTLTATAWLVLGIPAAGLALKSALRPACRYCGSPDLADLTGGRVPDVVPPLITGSA